MTATKLELREFLEPTGRKRYAARMQSPVGDVWLVVDEADALVELTFETARAGTTDDVSLQERIEATGCELVWSQRRLAPVVRVLRDYFRGKERVLDFPLAPGGTPFQRHVWQRLLAIPYGATISYGELARRVGRPKAARAVGRANGTNPIAVVVPCHRVIGADGSLTGYGGGMERKRRLLELEGAPVDAWSRGLGAEGCGSARASGRS